MQHSLSTEQTNMVKENLGLIRKCLKRICTSEMDYDDLFSIGKFGLIKAVLTLDITKENTFATYACKCIKNEIYMSFRKSNKYHNNISLDDALSQDIEDNELTLSDIIADNSVADVGEQMIVRESICKLVSIILNCLPTMEKIVYLYNISGATQKYTAKILNISQSYTSRLIKRSRKKINEYYESEIEYKEVYSVKLIDNYLYIVFSTADTKKLIKNFSDFMIEIDNSASRTEFNIIHENERVVFSIPADADSFKFIAKFVEQMNSYSLKHKIHKEKISIKDEFSKKNTNKEKCEETKSNIHKPDKKKCNIKNTCNDKQIVINKGDEESKAIIAYMFELNNFTVSDIKIKFESLSKVKIDSVIRSQNYNGTIIRIGRCQYEIKNNLLTPDTKNYDIKDALNDKQIKINKGKEESKAIIAYMFELKNFTISDIKVKFSSLSNVKIDTVIRSQKRKGIIINTGKGMYEIISKN